MPTYQYACTHCGERLEAVQKFTDEPLTVCSACSGRLRKVFSPVGIVFKGSGFYRTDSRADAKKSGALAAVNGSSKQDGSGKDSSGDKATAGVSGSSSGSSSSDAGSGSGSSSSSSSSGSSSSPGSASAGSSSSSSTGSKVA